jgi:hypothetical protein
MTPRTKQTDASSTALRADQLDALRRLAEARARLLDATSALDSARDDLHWAFRHAHRVGLSNDDLTNQLTGVPSE